MMVRKNKNIQVSLSKLMCLVFVPATIVIILYIGALNLRETVPPLLSYLLIGLFVLIPIQLGVIFQTSKIELGKFTLESALLYNNKLPVSLLMQKSIALFLIAGFIALTIGNLERNYMVSHFFQFVPDYFMIENFVNQTQQYSSSLILITCIVNAVVNGIMLPIVEELYFRGYLLSRVERFGKYAPLIITVLFSLYHFWAPWSNLMRIMAILPYTFSVFKNKNVYIGVIVHCAINIGSSISLFIGVYGVPGNW